ncbi:hypothetical protein Pfo_026502 [Paulownia fortunei]|nr:hypothetical protein Pfo_026502 [Paulownia fortunei]
MVGLSIASGSNLTKNRSFKGMADVEKILRELKHIIRKQVDAESKYVRKTRSLKRLMTGSDNKKLVNIDSQLHVRKDRSFKGESTDVENLLQQLKHKISLLVDTEAKHITKQELGKLRKFLTELSYEIDDCIDVITWGEIYGGANLKNLRKEIESVFRVLEQHDVANNTSDEESLRQRLHPDSTRSHKQLPSMNPIPPSSMVEEDQDYFFGPEKEEIKRLLLLSNTAQASIITLWGLGGLGKTTLLKKLYNDFDIRHRFQSFAWVSMPEDFQPRNTMQTILEQLLPGMKKLILEMSYVELTEQLYSVQAEKKCLIVLCDVRKRENWRRLTMAFPPADKTQSQILLTTREEDVATESGISYRINPLDENKSWELFKRRTEISFNQHAEKMLKEIVRRCKGSRLAIAILTEYVNNSDRSLSDWESLLTDELQSHLSKEETDLEQIVQNIVSLSYSKLPHELQECFLYLGHFPLEREIQVDELYVRWIDEGLISQTDGLNTEEKLMEVARHYLEELALRNLVEMLKEEKGPSIGSFKSCKLHPLVRDFCIIEAEKEELYKVIPTHQVGNQSRSMMVRRLSIKSKTYESGYPSRECAKASRLRSLSFFDTWEPPPEVMMSKQELFDLTELEWLRVLEFYGVDFRGWNLPNGIGELIYLRYLSFKRCYLENLPPSIGDLSHLKTLDLRVQAHCRMSIPNVLWKLARLKRLYFPLRFECADSHVRLSLESLEELEILVNFNTEVCDASDLRVMKKLQNMGAVVEENHKDLEKIIDFTNVVFTNLRDSSLDVRNFNCYSAEKRAVLEKLLGCEPLRSLRLEGYIKQLPVGMSMSPNLTEIVLSGAELEEDPMPRFGQIPKLRSLILCNDAYIGKKMDCLHTGFPELRSLKIKNLRCIETWAVQEGAMPKLLSLSIEKCVKLVMLPAGLKSVAALRELKIVSMPAEFEARLRVMEGIEGEDVRKVNQVASIIISS